MVSTQRYGAGEGSLCCLKDDATAFEGRTWWTLHFSNQCDHSQVRLEAQRSAVKCGASATKDLNLYQARKSGTVFIMLALG
jgi:hypothetical protein